MSDAALVLDGVRRTFHQGEKSLEVLKGADLAVQPGEIVALVGPSGRGQVDVTADRGPVGTTR